MPSATSKEVALLVERVNAEFAKLNGLSNDELRARTAAFKERIREQVKDGRTASPFCVRRSRTIHGWTSTSGSSAI